MSAEFFIQIESAKWLEANHEQLIRKLKQLSTFVQEHDNHYWLKGTESRTVNQGWAYDARLIFLPDERILLEISAHPPSVEQDLKNLLSWMREGTNVNVVDEDGENSGW